MVKKKKKFSDVVDSAWEEASMHSHPGGVLDKLGFLHTYRRSEIPSPHAVRWQAKEVGTHRLSNEDGEDKRG